MSYTQARTQNMRLGPIAAVIKLGHLLSSTSYQSENGKRSEIAESHTQITQANQYLKNAQDYLPKGIVMTYLGAETSW